MPSGTIWGRSNPPPTQEDYENESGFCFRNRRAAAGYRCRSYALDNSTIQAGRGKREKSISENAGQVLKTEDGEQRLLLLNRLLGGLKSTLLGADKMINWSYIPELLVKMVLYLFAVLLVMVFPATFVAWLLCII